MIRVVSGVILGSAITALVTFPRTEPPAAFALAPPDRVAIARLEGRTMDAESRLRTIQADTAELWLLMVRQNDLISELRLRLDAARRGGAWPLPQSADIPDSERIPPQNLPVPIRPVGQPGGAP